MKALSRLLCLVLSLVATSALAQQRYAIINVNSGMAVGVSYASLDDGANVAQFRHQPGAANQTWILESQSDGSYAIRNANSGHYLAVWGGSTDNEANIVQQRVRYYPGPAQKWDIQRVADGSVFLINVQSGLAMGVSYASTMNGANIAQFWWEQGSYNQRWRLQPAW